MLLLNIIVKDFLLEIGPRGGKNLNGLKKEQIGHKL